MGVLENTAMLVSLPMRVIRKPANKIGILSHFHGYNTLALIHQAYLKPTLKGTYSKWPSLKFGKIQYKRITVQESN